MNNNDVQESSSSIGGSKGSHGITPTTVEPTGLSGFINRNLLSILAIVFGLIFALVVIFWPSSESDNFLTSSDFLGGSEDPALLSCPVYHTPGSICIGAGNSLCADDMETAKIAWKYFENNYQPKTGLVNAADKYPSTTMWDTGSSLGATIAAREFGIITQKDFDDRVVNMMATLNTIELFNNEAPNKVYNTITGGMVDYGNQPSEDGIGVSTLDLGRLISWLNILSCIHPKHAVVARNIILRWKFCNLIKDGQMFGMARDPVTNKIDVLQEGRLGYEQYVGKIFQMIGFDQSVSATYNNKFATTININDVPIAYDVRDPRKLGAYNYVVTESYVMDVFENGIDEENKPLTENIFEVQKRQWEKTGVITAVSEDNIDRPPSFIYNTIFAAGSPWNAITDTGQDMAALKTLSTKAALSLFFLYPDREYSAVLKDAVSSAYDPKRGWYSGIYEKGLGYNDVMTANTNGVILGGLLYKMYGSLQRICSNCNLGISIPASIINAPENKDKCLPGSVSCNTCTN